MSDKKARRDAVIKLLTKHHNLSANSIGYNLRRQGLVGGRNGGKGNDCLAATSILRSMKRDKLADFFLSSHDQWAVRKWFITEKARTESTP